MGNFVVGDQIDYCLAFTQYVGQLFRYFGDIWNIFEIVGIAAVVIGNTVAVGPYADGCTGSVAVGFELFFAIFKVIGVVNGKFLLGIGDVEL